MRISKTQGMPQPSHPSSVTETATAQHVPTASTSVELTAAQRQFAEVLGRLLALNWQQEQLAGPNRSPEPKASAAPG